MPIVARAAGSGGEQLALGDGVLQGSVHAAHGVAGGPQPFGQHGGRGLGLAQQALRGHDEHQAGVLAGLVAARDLAAQSEASVAGFHDRVPVHARLPARLRRSRGRRDRRLPQDEVRALLAHELRVALGLELGSIGQLEAHAMGGHDLIIAYVMELVQALWICL